MVPHESVRDHPGAVFGYYGNRSSDTGHSIGISDPVQHIDWYHAIAFCNKLSIAEGLDQVYSVSGVDFTTLTYGGIPTSDDTDWDDANADWSANGYRLPTEMEWMWAAMGATAVPVIQAQRI